MANVDTVKMEDGTTREFSGATKVLKESSADAAGAVTTRFAFRNGTIREFYLSADMEMYARAAQHGLDQKFGDAFAGTADVDDCVLIFDKIAEQLIANDWNKGRASDGMAGTSVLAKALVKVTGKSVDHVKATLKTLDAAQKAALRKQPKIAHAILEIESAKVSKGPKVDAEEVLAAFA